MRASLLKLVFLAICANGAQAGIYTCTDKDGNIVYSDTPTSEACTDTVEDEDEKDKKVEEVPPIEIYTPERIHACWDKEGNKIYVDDPSSELCAEVADLKKVSRSPIYVCKDSEGNKIYLDTPSPELCPEAEEVALEALPPLIRSKPVQVPLSIDTKPKKAIYAGYESLAITTPAHEESLRENTGKVLVAYQVSPALNEGIGHQYVIMLDNKEIYKGTNTSILIENVDRGTHVVTAKIVARNGRTLVSSESVEFTLHRFSRLQRNPLGSPPPPPQPSTP